MPTDPAHWTDDDADAHKRRVGELALMEERRLAYVAYTRAAERLVLSGHWWGRTQQKPLGPSEFLLRTQQWLADRGDEPTVWADRPADGATNPHLDDVRIAPWPAEPPLLDRRHALAEAVRAQLADPRPVELAHAELDQLELDIELLLAEADVAAELEREVALPASLSSTSVLTLAKDPTDLARQLARPMPREPSPAARFGTRFHAWVEAHYGQQVLLDPTDLPGRGDVDLASDAELDQVIDLFRSGPYADRSPFAIEAPFSIVLGGQQVIGRIDAVFRDVDEDGRERFEVVDWKTNRAATADPLQLAVYRLAWAEMNGLDLADVVGAFYYVRLGEVKRFDDLLGRDALERVIAGESVGS